MEYLSPVVGSGGCGWQLGSCPQESEADWSWHRSQSRIQTGSAQSCREEQTGHDTVHILRSHHAKYCPIAMRHNLCYESPLRKDDASSGFFSLLVATSDSWCQKHRLRLWLLLGGYGANDQPSMVEFRRFYHHIVSMHRNHIQDRRPWFLLDVQGKHSNKVLKLNICTYMQWYTEYAAVWIFTLYMHINRTYAYNMLTTLHCLTKQRAGLFPQTMHHHGLVWCRSLIGFASLTLDPFLMEIFRALDVHIFSITPSKNVIWCMIYTVHLFRLNNAVAFLVCVGE